MLSPNICWRDIRLHFSCSSGVRNNPKTTSSILESVFSMRGVLNFCTTWTTSSHSKNRAGLRSFALCSERNEVVGMIVQHPLHCGHGLQSIRRRFRRLYMKSEAGKREMGGQGRGRGGVKGRISVSVLDWWISLYDDRAAWRRRTGLSSTLHGQRAAVLRPFWRQSKSQRIVYQLPSIPYSHFRLQHTAIPHM